MILWMYTKQPDTFMMFIRVVSIQIYNFIFLNSILKEASLFIFKTINFTRITVILAKNEIHTNKILEIEIETLSRTRSLTKFRSKILKFRSKKSIWREFDVLIFV